MTNELKTLSHFYVTLNGADAPDELISNLLDVAIESSLHLPDVATVTFNDSQMRWIDHTLLEPGVTLQVLAKNDRDKKLIFDGEIVEIEPEFGVGMQRVVVRAFDRLHRLRRGNYARSFVNVTDGDLIAKLAQEVGLQTAVGPTPQVYPYVFQNNESNLDFLHKRASTLGYLLYVQGKTLHCDALRGTLQPIELKWGDTLLEFRPRMSTLGQINDVTVRGWDPKNRREIIGQATQGDGTPQVGGERNGGALTQRAFNLASPHLVADGTVRSQAQADALAKAVATRHAGRFIEAEGSCIGNPQLVAGVSVTIAGAGKRFSGTYLVTSVTHTYSPGQGYTTHFGISGLHANTLLSLLAPEAVPVSSTGLVVGIVTDNQDPEHMGRVKIKYPWLSSEHASYWARVVAVGGGPQRGIEFLPEINDEVLVGFEMGDIHYPYVLGGLWNGLDAPPLASDKAVSGGKVQQRTICSRAGHKITLDDSDGGGGVTIEDRKGNVIKLDSASDTLTIDVKGNALLKAKGDFSVEAQGNLTLKAQGKTQVNGMGVTVDGGAATVDVKGMMINLN